MPLLSYLFITASLGLAGMIPPVVSPEPWLEAYLLTFDYAARRDMKIESKDLVQMLKAGKAQLVDIRFKEEFAAWSIKGSLSIPLNELPRRLAELDRSKVIVTACPHNDRAVIAMTYLRSKGISVKYLSDGLLKLADQLRGETAWDFVAAEK